MIRDGVKAALRLVGIVVLSILCACVAARAGTTSSGSRPPSAPPWHNQWLCLPLRGGPGYCRGAQKTTIVYPNGSRKVVTVSAAANPPIDCFYVYPTVSAQLRGNSTLTIESQEKYAAIVQASGFSRVCRVYAPMYRQVTAYASRFHPDYSLPYDDVLAAWRSYLAHDNHGRGVVLIGHSQGAFVLEELIQKQIEHSAERKLLVSAILLGGDVTVKDGSTEGGEFANLPACTSSSETGCVIAYSSWERTPPGDAVLQQVAKPASQHVLCVNPGAPGSAKPEPITPIFYGAIPEGVVSLDSAYSLLQWGEFPDMYTARCVQQGSRAWLLVTRVQHPGDPRPSAYDLLGPMWGLHAADVNIALASLVSLVASESRAWLHHR